MIPVRRNGRQKNQNDALSVFGVSAGGRKSVQAAPVSGSRREREGDGALMLFYAWVYTMGLYYLSHHWSVPRLTYG